MSCQFSRPFASRAKLPLPPVWPVSVEPDAYPSARGGLTPAALPPTNPPPPIPRNRPFQFAVGMATQIFTLSPAGGCVVTAVTRHMPELDGSTAADSIVVLGRRAFGSASMARLSQDRTGFALGTTGFGVAPSGGPP